MGQRVTRGGRLRGACLQLAAYISANGDTKARSLGGVHSGGSSPLLARREFSDYPARRRCSAEDEQDRIHMPRGCLL